MEEFNHINPENHENDNPREQEVKPRVPQYSFWAEQMQGSGSPNYNPSHTQPNSNDGRNDNPNYTRSNPSDGRNDSTGYTRPNPNDGRNYIPNNTWPNPDYGMNDAPHVENREKKIKKHRSKRGVKFIAKAVCFGIIGAISFVSFQSAFYHFNPDAAGNIKENLAGSGNIFGIDTGKKYEISSTQQGSLKTASKSAISDMVNNTISSIVAINSVSTQPNTWFGRDLSQEVEGSGSGIILSKNENELLIATNNHVVAGTDKITVTFINDKEAEAVIKGTDATADLAVISVDVKDLDKETLDAISIAKLGNSDDVKVGEMSIAIGNALGYGQSVTVGYISAKDREVSISDGYNENKMVLLQTDAAINPGNSGGALLNMNGEVIGINSVKYASNEVEGMGYAIPISKATPIINELMSREILKAGEQGYLGIGGIDVTEDISKSYNMPIGVFISELDTGAAKEAGLLKGDIITKVNDVEITSIQQLADYIKSQRAGTEVTITYMRSSDSSYGEKVMKVVLGHRPASENTD